LHIITLAWNNINLILYINITALYMSNEFASQDIRLAAQKLAAHHLSGFESGPSRYGGPPSPQMKEELGLVLIGKHPAIDLGGQPVIGADYLGRVIKGRKPKTMVEIAKVITKNNKHFLIVELGNNKQ
jgi:hypothetical protein